MHRATADESNSRAIAAYDRACHAIQLSRYGQASAPVQQLSDSALATLFTPQSYEKLIAVNFYNAPPSCRQNQDDGKPATDGKPAMDGKPAADGKRGK